MSLTVRSRYDAMQEHRDVLIIDVRPDGTKLGASPLRFELLDQAVLTEPTIGAGAIDGDEFLQAILNHAWEIGMRPVGFADTPKEIAAIRDHLADLRTLVFKGQIKPKGAA